MFFDFRNWKKKILYKMVCDKCAKKLSKVVVQDTWRDGARNLTTTEKKGN